MKELSHSKVLLLMAGSRRLFFSLAFNLLCLLSFGQSINKVEYFFDTDPGFGNGSSVAVTPTPNLSNLSFNVNIAALSVGFHNLYIRAKDDSGSWSHTNARTFYKIVSTPAAANLSKAEYFFDSDPGFGNGAAVLFPNVSGTDSLSFMVDISSLSNGFHYLFVRAMDQNGRWSLTHYRSFYKISAELLAPNMASAEYFFDTDPGFGAGTNIVFAPATTIDPYNFTVDITSLSSGFHELFIRAKDANGIWSQTQQRSFYKVPSTPTESDVVGAEYFFDIDPGFGSGTSIPVSPSSTIDTLDLTIDITSLSEGYHNIFVRAKDASGRWSITHNKSFYKVEAPAALPDITRIEYFFDTDPGLGNGTAISFTPAPNKFLNFSINIQPLSRGFHQLFVRAKDSLGNWSQTVMRTLYKEIISSESYKIKRIEYFFDQDPGFGLATNVPLSADTNNLEMVWDIDITGLSQGFHSLHVRAKDSRGLWSLTQFRPFYKQLVYDTLPDIVKIEYFYDVDPGRGNGINVPVTPTQNITFITWPLNLANVAYGQHQLFVRTKDEYGKWSLTTHDTIFYYLDSLPTAAMNGPMGVCIYNTATFEVNLTGTAPWTVIYNDGFQVDTATNITVTPFSFQVVPQVSGTKTARVLKVMDAYYTGLYTGIPIDYEVYPLPAAIGTMYGPVDVCQGSQNVSYSVYGVADATAYEWTVPTGATIVSQGYYWYYGSNYIVVDFASNAQSGVVSVKAKNACGYGQSNSIAVSLHDVPEVEIGPDIFLDYNDTAYMTSTVTTGTAPYTYSWSPWWMYNNSSLPDPMAFPSSNTNVTLSITDAFGCSASDQIMVYVGPPAGTTVSGKLTYDNNNAWPMAGSTIYLKQGNTVVNQTVTDAQGNYSISGIPAGYYTISGGSSLHPWGGVNSTDALLIMKHFAGISSLIGYKVPASDVNASGNTNSIDALKCAQRFVGIINSFNSGDWYVESVYFYANVIGSQEHNLKGLVFGDVDGSYNPVVKEKPAVELKQDGSMEIPASGSVVIPVIVNQDMQTAAVSLVLNVPDGLVVKSVNMAKGSNANLVFNVMGEELRIAWYAIDPVEFMAGETLLNITIAYGSIPANNWSIGEDSKLADAQGATIFPVSLNIPKLAESTADFELGENYPNPFLSSTVIPFTLPENAHVRLSLLNLLGEEIMLLTDKELPAGRHEIGLNAQHLAAGVYQYRIVVQSDNMRYEQTRKMSVIR